MSKHYPGIIFIFFFLADFTQKNVTVKALLSTPLSEEVKKKSKNKFK